MQSVANIFLILFLNTAVLGIADALFSEKFGLSWLAALYDFADDMSVFFAFVIYIGFALNKHLPKRVLVPPLILLLWGLIDFWPLMDLFGSTVGPFMLIVQLLLGLLVLQQNLALNKQSRLLISSQFAGPAFCSRNFFRYILFNIPLLPLVILLLTFSSIGSLLDEQGAGFMRLKPNGLYMVEKVYRKGEKKIRLASMIHLGQQSYFDSLSASLVGQQAILLAEGVSDKDGRLQGKFNYEKLADLLGLSVQEEMLIDGRLVDAASLDRLADKQPGRTDILHADIDLTEFDERTIEVLNALGRYVLNNDSLAEGFRDFNRWTEQNTNPEINRVVMDDLLRKRNRALLRYLPQALQKYDTVVIPWGALHMPGLEIAVQNKGFHLQAEHERLSVDFFQLPYGRLLGSQVTD